MEIPQETEDYIRESIDHSVGLPVSTDTLLDKINAVEAANVQLRHQNLYLQSKHKEWDEVVKRSRAEASMNAVALMKFVEENQKLAVECSRLLAECNKWEKECSLHDHDREALFDFVVEVDKRAKETESRIQELEEEKKKLEEELHFYKPHSQGLFGDVSTDDPEAEHIHLYSLLTSVFGDDESTTAHSFLEEHISLEACQKLLENWSSSSLRPGTQKVIALAADLKSLEQDNDNLTTHLRKAEEEVHMLCKENSILHEEVKSLMKQCYKGSASGKGKRKSSPRVSSPEIQPSLSVGKTCDNAAESIKFGKKSRVRKRWEIPSEIIIHDSLEDVKSPPSIGGSIWGLGGAKHPQPPPNKSEI